MAQPSTMPRQCSALHNPMQTWPTTGSPLIPHTRALANASTCCPCSSRDNSGQHWSPAVGLMAHPHATSQRTQQSSHHTAAPSPLRHNSHRRPRVCTAALASAAAAISLGDASHALAVLVGYAVLAGSCFRSVPQIVKASVLHGCLWRHTALLYPAVDLSPCASTVYGAQVVKAYVHDAQVVKAYVHDARGNSAQRQPSTDWQTD